MYIVIQQASFGRLAVGTSRFASFTYALPAIIQTDDGKEYISKIPENQDDVTRVNQALQEGNGRVF